MKPELKGHRMNTTLIIGTYRQTLTVIRSLARAGQRIVLGVNGDAATCNRSRYVDEIWQHPDPKSEHDEFATALSRLLADRADIQCIIPVGESDIRFFVHHYAEFERRVSLLMCNPGIVETCLHKPTMSAMVDELGIPQARYAIATDKTSLIAAADSIGCPCIVKLADSEHLLHGRKAIVYYDPNTLLQELTDWPFHDKQIVVQEYVQGERHNLYFFADDGRINALGQTLALRTDRVDGTGLSVSGMTVRPIPDLVGYCQTIVEHLSYSGAGCMQFIVDHDNRRISFLEHNPRLGAGFAMLYHTGLDLTRLMLQSTTREFKISAGTNFPCKVDTRYAWITGDLAGLRRAFKSRQVGAVVAGKWIVQILVSAFTSSVHITWDWRDPLPTVMQMGRILRLIPGVRGSGKPEPFQ